MTWMNEYDVEDAVAKWRVETHPNLAAASLTLMNLVKVTNRNSDGWPYWRKPANAAKRLMDLITGDGTWAYNSAERADITVAELRAAYRPIKSFLTRNDLSMEFAEPGIAAAAERAAKELAAERERMERVAAVSLTWLRDHADDDADRERLNKAIALFGAHLEAVTP